MEETKDPVRERSDYQRMYYQAHKAKRSEQHKNYYKANRARILQQQKAYHAAKKLQPKVNEAAPQAVQGYLTKKFKVGVVHEVIGPVAQKLRFDMDIYKVDWEKQMDWTPEDLESYFNELIECIHEGFQDVYGRNLDPDSIVICDSTGDDKYSRHVIINGWHVINHTEAKYFYTKVMKLLEDRSWPTEFVDGQIYSAVQNFRMTGFTKRGRTKKIISNHTFSDTLITYIPDSKLLEQQCIETPVTFAPITEKFLMTLSVCI
jgi:hypothetical protein